MKLFHLFLVVPSCLWAVVEVQRFTVNELELMAKRKEWARLVLSLHDVPQADHDLQWESLVERSAVGYLKGLKDSGVSDVEKVGQDLLNEYASLRRSTKFQNLQDDILIEGFERCYQSVSDKEMCGKRLIAMLQERSVSANFRQRAAKLAVSQSPEMLKAV